MNQINSVVIEGTLVNEPEVKTLPSGIQVCTLNLSVTSYYRDKEGENKKTISFFEVDVWGKNAEIFKDSPENKGKQLRVVGRLKQERWTGAQEQKYSKNKIIAEHIDMKSIVKLENQTVNEFNSVIIEGTLTHDPQITTFPSGNQVCTLSLATNRYYKDKQGQEKNDVTFIEVDVWGKNAEMFKNPSVKKGRGLRVVGSLKQERWINEQEQKRSKIKIIADHIELKPTFRIQKKEQDNWRER